MDRYYIRPTKEPLPDLYGVIFDPDEVDYCCENGYAPIECYMWDATGYTPEARAYITWDNGGLHVLMCACEQTISAETKQFGGPVYRDSCLELFLQPFSDDARYINIEVNAAGAALIGFGAGRAERTQLSELPEGMDITVSRHRGEWWAVAYTVPPTLFKALYGRTPLPGSVMRGNLYTCDETIHPHFGSWSPIIHFQPDFHRPEWFAELVLAANRA